MNNDERVYWYVKRESDGLVWCGTLAGMWLTLAEARERARAVRKKYGTPGSVAVHEYAIRKHAYEFAAEDDSYRVMRVRVKKKAKPPSRVLGYANIYAEGPVFFQTEQGARQYAGPSVIETAVPFARAKSAAKQEPVGWVAKFPSIIHGQNYVFRPTLKELQEATSLHYRVEVFPVYR